MECNPDATNRIMELWHCKFRTRDGPCFLHYWHSNITDLRLKRWSKFAIYESENLAFFERACDQSEASALHDWQVGLWDPIFAVKICRNFDLDLRKDTENSMFAVCYRGMWSPWAAVRFHFERLRHDLEFAIFKDGPCRAPSRIKIEVKISCIKGPCCIIIRL